MPPRFAAPWPGGFALALTRRRPRFSEPPRGPPAADRAPKRAPAGGAWVSLVLVEASYAFSPGARYRIEEAFCRAWSVSSTLSKAVVCRELKAPPALIAMAVAAMET
jgi:hypothetical protein